MLAFRRLEVTITLAEGQFGEREGETVILKDFRVRAHINSVGGQAQGQCQCVIYGLPLSTINKLTTIGPIHAQIRGRNALKISAGIEGDTLHDVFLGYVHTAYGDFNSAPDAGLVIMAHSSAPALAKPVEPTSYQGAVECSQIMADLAKEAGMAFVDAGVKVTLSNPYFSGTTLDKIKACARAADIYFSTDKNTLSIWKVGGFSKDNVLNLTPSTGLVGYPQFSSTGISVKSIFAPQAALGGKLELRGTEVEAANGDWTIYNVVHSLESRQPNGEWFTHLEGSFYVGN
ncbi:MAG: baseplate hub protein [Candidatus Binatia bacterium]